MELEEIDSRNLATMDNGFVVDDSYPSPRHGLFLLVFESVTLPGSLCGTSWVTSWDIDILLANASLAENFDIRFVNVLRGIKIISFDVV